jgi:hypothetical protein
MMEISLRRSSVGRDLSLDRDSVTESEGYECLQAMLV